MGFKEGVFPPVDPETFLEKPLMERMKTLALHWCEYGFGTPKMVHTIYIMKLVVFYTIGGLTLILATSDLPAFWNVGDWWDQPVVYQKAIMWTMLLEAIGIAGSWGPLAGKFKPMTGGIRYWARPDTIRMPPWKQVPFTAGHTRTVVDAALYVGFLVTLLAAIVAQPNDEGLVRPALLIAPIVLLVLLGLRDQIAFLAARSEQYLPALIFFAVFDFVDMIVALKLLIVIIWIGAGVSKWGHHFAQVVAPMISNSPSVVSRKFRLRQYKNFPEDIRPSKLAHVFAHGGGTLIEVVTPLVLLFSTNDTLTAVAVGVMVIFHLFIISAFPLAVPLEWNVLFAYATVFLFWGFKSADGFGIGDMSSPGLTVALLAVMLFFPIAGNLMPQHFSFLVSLRQYAGNWASALWAFQPGCESKLNALTRSSANQIDQLIALGYDPKIAEITMQQTIGWRSMHSQGRGLFSLLMKHVPNLDKATVREAEFAFNSISGFNFGDGHWHDEKFVAEVQRRCKFEPGEWIVVWVESQPIHKKTQEYLVIDAAIGVIERGTWNVAEAVHELPWLPNGPIPLTVTWTRAGGALPTQPETSPALDPQVAPAT